MPIRTALTERLGTAPDDPRPPWRARGDTPALVAAVGEAGGLGCVGAAHLTPAQIAETAQPSGAHAAPFGINLFAPLPAPEPPADLGPRSPASPRTTPSSACRRPSRPSMPRDTFPDLLAAALESGAALFSFTFGLLPPEAVAAVRARGMLLAGTATTVEEAVGAGARRRRCRGRAGQRGRRPPRHLRGDFGRASSARWRWCRRSPTRCACRSSPRAESWTGAAWRQRWRWVPAAVQIGTAFLTCDEAGIADAYKEAILAARSDTADPRLLRPPGPRHRQPVHGRGRGGRRAPMPSPVPAPERADPAAAGRGGAAGRAEFLSLWAGQGLRLARRQPAAELVARLAAEAEAAIGRLGRSLG